MAIKQFVPASESSTDLLEAGGRIIYGWRTERQNDWKDCSSETRAAYRARMQELVNVLYAAGFTILREGRRR